MQIGQGLLALDAGVDAPGPMQLAARGNGMRFIDFPMAARWIRIVAVALLGFYPTSSFAETDSGSGNIRMTPMAAEMALAGETIQDHATTTSRDQQKSADRAFGPCAGQRLAGAATSEWRFYGQHDPNRAEDVCDAVAQGDLGFLGAMVRHGMNIDIADELGRTPLMCALDSDVAGFLLQHGADPKAADQDGFTVLHYHLRSEAALALVPVLLEHGVTPQTDGPPLLRELVVRFIEWKHYEQGKILLQMLVAAGWDIDERDLHGDTLLHVAAHNDNLPLAESVLSNGAEPGLLDGEGRTAAAIAREAGSINVLDALFTVGEHTPRNG
ncbi:ankyrin repeat domain-containing protein [Desulfobulbus alkaliphilus]|uniref:ankyrin repeat domain-containing protein n=1 Tax=Desulfobulbus alkaliphilus TaxID=869814 RepID=UPI001966AD8A|nr:ankyrin repeat domain-containing protein [Desulfobulbus alkaliphilus]MBM9537546.1 hypothetical protein [Desulfobulbus alkaliphilus]